MFCVRLYGVYPSIGVLLRGRGAPSCVILFWLEKRTRARKKLTRPAVGWEHGRLLELDEDCTQIKPFNLPLTISTSDITWGKRRGTPYYISSATHAPNKSQPTFLKSFVPPSNRVVFRAVDLAEHHGFRRRGPQHRRHHWQCHLLRPLPLPCVSPLLLLSAMYSWMEGGC